jgi:hypothetical protein
MNPNLKFGIINQQFKFHGTSPFFWVKSWRSPFSLGFSHGQRQVSSMSREELLQLVGKLQEALSEAQKQVEQGRLSCEAGKLGKSPGKLAEDEDFGGF